MSRSTKDSDDEEWKTGRMQTRMLSTYMVNSPLRRSSRIKQAKTSPESESDTSSSSQPIKTSRQRTATMDSIVSETVNKRLTRRTSVSSDLYEADIDIVGTPTKKRITRNSLSATATPTNTRATNKRFTRANSEAKSPPQIIRKTRSNSVEPESLQEKNKIQSGTPVRIRRRASVLPLGSPVKEEIEEGSITSTQLNPTITEIDEHSITSIDKTIIVPVLLKSDEILLLSQNKSKIRGEHMDQAAMNKEQTVVKDQCSSEDENSIHNSSNLLKSNKEDKSNKKNNKEDKSKETLLQVEQSLIDIIDLCEDDSPTKDSAENSLNTFIEERKKDNKENQTSNIISDASMPVKNIPLISNVISISTKSPTSFVSKLEKEKKSEETNKISLTNQTETQEKNVSEQNVDITIIAEDSNEMNLILEERSPSRHENEALLNATDSDDENSKNQSNIMDKQSIADDIINNDAVQDDVIDNADSTEQEQNLSEHVTKSQPESSNIIKINLESSDSDVSSTVNQDDQPSDIMKTSEKPAVDISGDNILELSQPAALSQEAESKDSSSSKTISEQMNACDVLEIEEESSQLEKNKENLEDIDVETIDKNSEVDTAIKLFRDISADEWEKKNNENDEVSSVSSNRQSETKQESDAECDLILVDKQAWLTAKDIKEQEEKEAFEYDSDDTVLLKSQLDAAQASNEIKALAIVNDESIDVDSKKDVEEEVEEITKRKLLTKKRSISKGNKDSSPECTDDEDISIVKSEISLNQSNNQSCKLNISGQTAKVTEQTHDNSDEGTEDDANELNEIFPVNKKNISLRKLTNGRKSLNKSLTNTSSTQEENGAQMSPNKSEMDISEEDNTDAHTEKSLKQTKSSLNKSRDNETVIDVESEKDLSNKDNKTASLNRSINNKSKTIQVDESSSDDEKRDVKGNNDKIIALKNHSTIVHAGTTDTNSSDSSKSFSMISFLHLFNKSGSNDDTDDTINSDIRKEYNLNGTKQKFSDDNVPGDECRASESEYSDSNDSGSDLADFIVSDDEGDKEEEEDNEDEDDLSMEKDDENLEDEEVITKSTKEKYEVENKDGEDQQNMEESDENKEEDEILNDEIENKDDKNAYLDNEEEDLSEKADVEILELITNKEKGSYVANFIRNLRSRIKSSTPKQSADKQTCLISGSLIHPTNIHSVLLGKKAEKNILLTEKSKTPVQTLNASLKEFDRISNEEEKLNRSLPPLSSSSDLSDIKIKKPRLSKINLARFHKTMKVTDDDMSTIRHLMKEKLSESVPLRFDSNITPLKKKLLLREETQIETKGENNEEEESNPITPSTDAVQKHSQQKKRKKQAKEALNENITDQDSQQKKRKKQVGEALNENITDREQKDIKSKTKIEIVNRSPMLTKDATSKNVEPITKKKKKKQIDVVEQKENVSDDNTANSKLGARKKKLAQHTTMLIAKDNSQDSNQINEKKKKKKKKQIGIIEQEESVNEDKKNVQKNETELASRNRKKGDKIMQRDSFTDNYIVSEKKGKEKKILKNKETLSAEATKNIAQIKTKKLDKIEAYNQMMLLSDDTVRGQKKRKRQMKDTMNENIDEAQDSVEMKRKIKRIKFVANAEEVKFAEQREPVTKDDTYKDLDQINEKRKKKKKKQVTVTEQDNSINENDIPKPVEEKKKKKKKKQQQLDVNQQDNSINEEETYAQKSIGKKKIKRAERSNKPTYVIKRTLHPVSKNENFLSFQSTSADNTVQDLREIINKKKKIKQMEQDNNIIEDDTYAPEPVAEKKKKKKKQLDVIKQDYNIEDDIYAPEPVGEKKKKKKKQLDVIKQDYNIEDDTYAPEPVGEKKKKKKKQLDVIKQDYNIEDDTYTPEPVGEKKKKKKKQFDVIKQDYNIENDTYAPEPVGEKKKKRKRLDESQQDININEEDTYAPEAVGKRKKKKKNHLDDHLIQDNINEGDAPMSVGEKKRKKKKQIEQDRNVTELNPKLKLKKNLNSGKKLQVQNVSNTAERTTITKAWNEAREAIRAAEIRIKRNKELEKRKTSEEDVEKRNIKIKEGKKLVPSSMSNVKRLPSDVTENLSDIPKKKKRKFLRNEEQISDSPRKKKQKATKNDSELSLDVPGSSTQFTVINMQKAKKQPLKGAAAVALIRQKMLARNNREPVSAYMMYLEKQRAASNKKSPAF